MTVRPLVIAHRGASNEAPENTLPAFALAWQQDADGVECDVRLTADGEVVCAHDADTKRFSTQNLTVEHHSYAELKVVDVGAWKGSSYVGTPIPLLSALLQQVPSGKQVFIEVKCGMEILEKLTAEIQSSALEVKQVTVIAFDQAVVAGLKVLLPELRVYWLLDVRSNWLGRSKLDLARVLNDLRELGADGLGIRAHTGINQKIVAAFIQAGFGFNVWTVDRTVEARRLASLGVSSITSNRPGEILLGL